MSYCTRCEHLLWKEIITLSTTPDCVCFHLLLHILTSPCPGLSSSSLLRTASPAVPNPAVTSPHPPPQAQALRLSSTPGHEHKYLWISSSISPFRMLWTFLWDLQLGMNFLGHKEGIYLFKLRTARVFSRMAAPICTPNNRAWRLSFPYILTNRGTTDIYNMGV